MNQLNSDRPGQLTRRARKGRVSYDWIAFGLVALGLGLAASYLFTPAGMPIRSALARLFALTSDQGMWYLTRAAGMMAYLLLWLSTVWGLLIPSKLFGNVLNGEFSFDFHQFISLLSLGFLGLHIVVLTADRYLPFSVAQLLVPFISPYRPLWVGIGVVAFYLLLLVTVTFYMRMRIGMKAFRYIHFLSLALIHLFRSSCCSTWARFQLLFF
jgi:predicted ferric reductase